MPRVCLAILLLVLAGCAAVTAPTGSPTPTPPLTPGTTPASPAPSASPTASVTPIPLTTPSPPASSAGQVGLPSAGCVNGWQAPAPDSELWRAGLALVEERMGEPVSVVEMRYFSGPDVPWIIEPHHEVVERWYVKGTLGDGGAGGRWLVEQRTEQVRGVSAVALSDSAGYASPDWTGFVGDGPPRHYPGLPGTWSGIAYDFVTGEGDSGQPGLPDEVADCLAGT